MGVEKSEIKMAVAHDIGCRLEDSLEAARVSVHRWEGGKRGHQQACKGLDGLLGQITLDLKEGSLTMDEAKLAQRWVQRARGLTESLALQSDVLICQAKGKVEGLEHAIGLTKKLYDAEERKKTAIESPEEPDERLGDRQTRAVGTHPGPSLAQTRREEKEEPAKKTPKKPSKRKCGKCGEPGHTVRTCKKKAKKKS